MAMALLAIAVSRARNPVEQPDPARKRRIDDIDAKANGGSEAVCQRTLPVRGALRHRRVISRRTIG